VAEVRPPLHVFLLAAGAAGAYAVSLAAVTALQSQTDASLIATRAPIADAIDAVATGHGALERAVTRAADDYARSAAGYDELTATLTDVESALDGLAAQTRAVGAVTAGLPSRVRLPTVRYATGPAPVAAPRTHAVTGASGG
jgi:hypothetical protein